LFFFKPWTGSATNKLTKITAEKSPQTMTIKGQNSSFASAVLIDDDDNLPSTPTAATAQMVPYVYSYPEDRLAHSNTTPSYTTTTVTTYPPPNTSSTGMIPHVGSSVNPYSAESVGILQAERMATKKRRKRRRAARTTVAAVSGVVVGGITLGPIGAIAGGIGAAAAARGACKLGERRKDRRVEQQRVAEGSVTNSTAILNGVSA
jgi:hypothetical protein